MGGGYRLFGLAGVAGAWGCSWSSSTSGDAIDSVAHISDDRPYDGTTWPATALFLGLFTLGEGWHAHHHSFPSSARHGLYPGQLDFIWRVIARFARLGLARNVRVPTAEQIARARAGAQEAIRAYAA